MGKQDTSNYADSVSAGKRGGRNVKVVVGSVIFLLGIIAGVVGLCMALKFIFYLGLVVAVVAAIAIVWGVIAVKRRITDSLGGGDDYDDAVDRTGE